MGVAVAVARLVRGVCLPTPVGAATGASRAVVPIVTAAGIGRLRGPPACGGWPPVAETGRTKAAEPLAGPGTTRGAARDAGRPEVELLGQSPPGAARIVAVTEVGDLRQTQERIATAAVAAPGLLAETIVAEARPPAVAATTRRAGVATRAQRGAPAAGRAGGAAGEPVRAPRAVHVLPELAATPPPRHGASPSLGMTLPRAGDGHPRLEATQDAGAGVVQVTLDARLAPLVAAADDAVHGASRRSCDCRSCAVFPWKPTGKE